MLMIQAANGDTVNKRLDDAIGRVMASMDKEEIAWIEQQVARSR